MINKTGLNNIVKNLSPKNTQPQRQGSSGIIVGRVTDIILDEKHPLFTSYGNYSSIGTIFFDTINKSNSGGNNFAKPINPQLK